MKMKNEGESEGGRDSERVLGREGVGGGGGEGERVQGWEGSEGVS